VPILPVMMHYVTSPDVRVFSRVCLSVCLSVSVSLSVSLCLSVCLSLSLSLWLAVCLPVCQDVCVLIAVFVQVSTKSSMKITSFLNILLYNLRHYLSWSEPLVLVWSDDYMHCINWHSCSWCCYCKYKVNELMSV